MMRQRDLALLVGVSQGRISEYERGEVEAMPLATAMAIAHVFGVPLEQVFVGLHVAVGERVRAKRAPADAGE